MESASSTPSPYQLSTDNIPSPPRELCSQPPSPILQRPYDFQTNYCDLHILYRTDPPDHYLVIPDPDPLQVNYENYISPLHALCSNFGTQFISTIPIPTKESTSSVWDYLLLHCRDTATLETPSSSQPDDINYNPSTTSQHRTSGPFHTGPTTVYIRLPTSHPWFRQSNN